MDEKELFAAGLGLASPWYVKTVDLDVAKKQLSIDIDFHKGAEFTCPDCAKPATTHDTRTTKWRHLDFWQHKTFITARHPRTKCDQHGVRLVKVPWGRKGSGFSFMFEAMVIALAQNMPMAPLARHLREKDTRLWRVVFHHVEAARSRLDLSDVHSIGVDETSNRKKHHYVTFFMDLVKRRIMFGTTGKDAKTFGSFVADLVAHGGDPEKIRNVCIDMSHAFKEGVAKNLPNASVTFDKFHVVKMLNDAMDKVRRQEREKHKGLKRSKYLWLRNRDRLTKNQAQRVEELSRMFPQTGLAYQLKETFLAIYDEAMIDAEEHLEIWTAWAEDCGLEPFEKFTATIRKNWSGVVNWLQTRIANGILEAINSLVQAAKAKARGYRNDRTLITMAYLIAGRLDYRLPT